MNAKQIIDAGKTGLAVAQLVVAGASTIYMGVIFVEGIAEVMDERKSRRRAKKSHLATVTPIEND